MALLLGIRGKGRARGKIEPPGTINIAKTESSQPWISIRRAVPGRWLMSTYMRFTVAG